MKKYPSTIIDLLSTAAELFPEQYALESNANKWKYFEINNTGNQIAHYLKTLASKENVIICMNRCDWMILAILGVLKSGNTYIPIDPLTPQIRINQIIEITNPKLIITDEFNSEKFKNNLRVIHIDRLKAALFHLPVTPIKINIDQHDTAYIIFTSGTTGLPKAVPIFHKSLWNKIYNFNPDLNFDAEHNFILLASIAFDASIGQIFLPLTHGSTLHIIEYEDQKNPASFWNYVIKHNINILYTIPSFLNALLETPVNLKNISFDYILLGAELFPTSLLSKIRSKLTVKKIVNMYGPTETTVNAIMHLMPGEDAPLPKTIPIGRPLPGYEIFIFDKNRKISKKGQLGEIAIGGVGLSPGYLNDPSLTKEKFIEKRLSGEMKRLYLTGDYGCVNKENQFEFFGRKDSQVKINGHRIELLEIEKVIKNSSIVKHCMVSLHPGNKDQIITFVEFVESDNTIEPTRILSNYLKTSLPNYMVPARIIRVSNFPILIAGKADKSKLFLLLEDKEEVPIPMGFSISHIEDEIIETWKEIFNNSTIKVNDNFMDLGGGSIQSILLVNKLLKKGIQIKPSDIFLYPTVSELAKVAQLIHSDKHLNFDRQNTNLQFSFSDAEAFRGVNDFALNKSKIESMGAYIPSNSKSTKEIIEGCINKIDFPIEKLTGIKSRAVAGPGEYSYQIAFNAIKNCLSKSALPPDEIELFICLNTSKSIGPKSGLLEPSFSLLLKKEFALKNALAFDINNACAGMFTAIEIADIMMKNNSVNNALIVSSEHITSLTTSAQLELENDRFDNRLACLTLGDAGVAITLTKSTDNTGFDFIHLLTLGEYSNLCIGKPSREDHGGFIMHTDSIRASDIGITPGIVHTFQSMKSINWSPEIVDYFIMHQTSITTIKNAMREMNMIAGKAIVTNKNTIINLENRGNTASNCQFLAFYENMMNGQIKDKSKIVFPISGSGRTMGTSLYSLDNLPAKLNSVDKPEISRKKKKINGENGSLKFGVKIESVSIYFPKELSECHTRIMNRKTALKCLAESDLEKEDIGLIIYSGIYRDECITEPAQAAFAAGDLNINSSQYSPEGKSTFCFDVMNDTIGTFNAIQIASEYIRSGRIKAALIIASEINFNRIADQPSVSPVEMGSALLLKRDTNINKGIGKFVNNSVYDFPVEKKVYTERMNSKTYLKKETFFSPQGVEIKKAITNSIKETLYKNEFKIESIHQILLPGIPEKLVTDIANELDTEVKTFYTPEKNNEDLGSSAVLYNLCHYMSHFSDFQNKTILIIGLGSGLTTGGVSYVF